MPRQSKRDAISAATLKDLGLTQEPAAVLPGKTYGPHEKRKPSMPILAKRDWQWNADSFFYQLPDEQGKRALFVAVEMTSRKGFIVPYKSSDATPQGVITALTALRAAYPINLLQTDQGGEFTSTTLKTWLAAQKPPVEHYMTQPGVKQEASMVESFNSELRHHLDIYTSFKRRNKGGYEDFNDYVSKTVSNYNNAKSSVLNATPASIDESKMGYIRLVLSERGHAYLKKLDAIEPGDIIRIWDAVDPRLKTSEAVDNFNQFHKGRHKWIDDQLFEVVDLSGYKVIVKNKGGTIPYSRRISPRDIQVVGHADKVESDSTTEPEAEAPQMAEKTPEWYYAVWGRVNGVFTDHKQVSESTKRVDGKGGQQRKFPTEKEAREYLQKVIRA
jgi:hypothetical protein